MNGKGDNNRSCTPGFRNNYDKISWVKKPKPAPKPKPKSTQDCKP
jgi:hypothetical protein